MPKYVVCTTLDQAEWNVSLIKGPIAEAVSELKRQPGQDVLVFGCGQLAHTRTQHNLIADRLIATRTPGASLTGCRSATSSGSCSPWREPRGLRHACGGSRKR